MGQEEVPCGAVEEDHGEAVEVLQGDEEDLVIAEAEVEVEEEGEASVLGEVVAEEVGGEILISHDLEAFEDVVEISYFFGIRV